MIRVFVKVTIGWFEIVVSQLPLSILNIIISSNFLIIRPYFLKLLVANVPEFDVLPPDVVTFTLVRILFRHFGILWDLVDDFIKVNLVQSWKLGLRNVFRIKINLTILFYLLHLNVIKDFKIWLIFLWNNLWVSGNNNWVILSQLMEILLSLYTLIEFLLERVIEWICIFWLLRIKFLVYLFIYFICMNIYVFVSCGCKPCSLCIH